MNKTILAAIAVLFLAAAPAAAEFSSIAAPAAAAIGGPIGSPTYVTPPSSGGVIKISQPFADWLQPYIDAAVNALLAAALAAALKWWKDKTGMEVDQKHRDALRTFLQNEAGSLIADGKVRVVGEGIHVDSAALASAAAKAQELIPAAAKRFNITPDYVASRIVDTIPQVAAGAQMIAAKAAEAVGDGAKKVLP